MRTDVASQRSIRFGVGTTVALLLSQILGGQNGYLAAVFAATFLSLPLPPPRLRGGIVFLGALATALLLGLLLIEPLLHQAMAGVLLLTLLLFVVFLHGASGGSPLIVTLAVAGLAAVPVVGVLHAPAAVAVCVTLMKAGLLALLVLWLSHALFPDPPASQAPVAAAARPPPDRPAAARLAVRSTLVVMPVIVWLLATGAVSSIAMAIKVASMGQQASADEARRAGAGLLASTCIGGLAAFAAWSVLRMWPSLLLYALLVLLAGLLMGRRVFSGAALAPTGQVWSYAYVTMLIILGPAVLDSGDGAGARFFDRMLLFLAATVYSVAAVLLFEGVAGARSGQRRPTP